jgi:hypothetical protein
MLHHVQEEAALNAFRPAHTTRTMREGFGRLTICGRENARRSALVIVEIMAAASL